MGGVLGLPSLPLGGNPGGNGRLGLRYLLYCKPWTLIRSFLEMFKFPQKALEAVKVISPSLSFLKFPHLAGDKFTVKLVGFSLSSGIQ